MQARDKFVAIIHFSADQSANLSTRDLTADLQSRNGDMTRLGGIVLGGIAVHRLGKIPGPQKTGGVRDLVNQTPEEAPAKPAAPPKAAAAPDKPATKGRPKGKGTTVPKRAAKKPGKGKP